jgi:cytochrome P450
MGKRMNRHATFAARTVPAHVDPARVIEFNVFADRRHAGNARPHDALAKLADDVGRGIFWSPYNGGHWVLNSHALIFEAKRDPETFSNIGVASLPPMPPELEPWLPPLGMDAPEHMKYRMPLMHAFSPERVRAMEGDIRALAAELIDGFEGQGHCEFVDALAEPLPLIIFMRLMGMDVSRLKEFRAWVKLMPSGIVEERTWAHNNINAMMGELIAARRIKREDDLISTLIDCEIDGKKLDDRQMLGMSMLLFGAGLDTVTNTLSLTMEHIARDPALQDRLRAEPHMIPEAVEELMRLYDVTISVRRVARDAEFHGVAMKADDRVLLVNANGDTDPAVYPNGAAFDLDRDNKTHLVFGIGPHRCAGAHLARLEFRVFLEEWFRRMPNVRLDPAKPVSYRYTLLLSAENLDLLWDRVKVT